MSLINRLKLARMIMQFSEIETDKGVLICDGTLEVGKEVFMEVEGELIPAADGEYISGDNIYTVSEGKISEIKEVEIEEEPEEPMTPTDPSPDEYEDERDARIVELESKVTELEAIIAERDARIAELEALLVEKEEQLQMSVAKPAYKEVKDVIISGKDNKALRYFENK